jgi:hypothetical protein
MPTSIQMALVSRSLYLPLTGMDAAICLDYAEGCSLRDGVIAHLGGCGVELAMRCVRNGARNRTTRPTGRRDRMGR